VSEDPEGRRLAAGERVAWHVDQERSVLTVTCRGGVTDDDLLSSIPRIWHEHPEVIACHTLVDARELTSEGGWSWSVLREIARRWREYACGRDRGLRIAIVTTDNWVAMLAGAFVLDYRGRRIRCFDEPADARDWVGRP
jgi:hypothetical protein